MGLQIAPLNSSFMLTAILGILISLVWVYPQAMSWGIAFTVVFALMLVASLLSMSYGNPDLELKMDAPKPKKKR